MFNFNNLLNTVGEKLSSEKAVMIGVGVGSLIAGVAAKTAYDHYKDSKVTTSCDTQDTNTTTETQTTNTTDGESSSGEKSTKE